MVLGISQFASSLVLGGIAIIYSRRVTLIESERRDLEKKKEKIELLAQITKFHGELAFQAAKVSGSLIFSKSKNTFELDKLDIITDKYKELKTNNKGYNKAKEFLARRVFSQVYNDSLFDKIEENSNMDECAKVDKDLYLKLFHLVDLLSIRDDAGDYSKNIKTIINNSESFVDVIVSGEHPLVYVVENRIYILSLILELNKIRDVIINS